MDKQDRIARMAGRLDSTATTVAGLYRYARKHGYKQTEARDMSCVDRGADKVLSYRSRSTTIGSRNLIDIAERVARDAGQHQASTCKGAWIRSKHASWVAHTRLSSGITSYAGSYKGYSLSYVNPGVYAEPLPGGDVAVQVCDHTGAVRATVRIAGQHVTRLLTREGVIPGDSYAVRLRKTVVARYDSQGLMTGYAVKYPDGWEHGKTFVGIRAERQHKLMLTKIATPTTRQLRAARLISRLPKLVLPVSSARAIGYCQAGIQGWLRSIGAAEDTQSLTVLSIPAQADERWLAVRDRRALEIAVEKF